MRNKQWVWAAWLLVTGVVLCAGAIRAADDGPLKSSLTVAQIGRAADGKEIRTPVKEVKPGDVLEYAAVFTNTGKTALKNVKPVIPIPQGTVYLPDTQKPANAQASLNGSEFEAVPLMRTVKAADGSKKVVKVPYEEYRAIRWNIDTLAAQDSATVTVRVRVSK